MSGEAYTGNWEGSAGAKNGCGMLSLRTLQSGHQVACTTTLTGVREMKVSHRHSRPQEAKSHYWLLLRDKRLAQKTSEGIRQLSLGWWMQIPVRDEVSSEDAAQYLINPVTGAYLRML